MPAMHSLASAPAGGGGERGGQVSLDVLSDTMSESGVALVGCRCMNKPMVVGAKGELSSELSTDA